MQKAVSLTKTRRAAVGLSIVLLKHRLSKLQADFGIAVDAASREPPHAMSNTILVRLASAASIDRCVTTERKLRK